MPEARDVDAEPRVMFEFEQLGEALEAKVARLRAEGFSREEVAGMTAEERTAALSARGAAFVGTQGRGKPMSFGHGSRERLLKETKQRPD